MNVWLLSSIGYDKPGRVEDSPMPSFYSLSPAVIQPQGTGGVLNLPLHEMEQDLEGKGWARALHSLTSLCRLYIDYRESTGSPLGVHWEWSGSGVGVHIRIM